MAFRDSWGAGSGADALLADHDAAELVELLLDVADRLVRRQVQLHRRAARWRGRWQWRMNLCHRWTAKDMIPKRSAHQNDRHIKTIGA